MSPPSSAASDKQHDTHIDNAAIASAETADTKGNDSRAEVFETSGGKAKKEDVHQQHLHPAWNYGAHIQRIPSPDTLSEISVGENGLLRPGRGSIALQPLRRIASASPGPPRQRTKYEWFGEFWLRNKGLAYVLLAQIFGVLMNVTTR